MKKILQLSIVILCSLTVIHAQSLEKRVSPSTSSNLPSVSTLERLSGMGFQTGDRVYDTNLEASYQYQGNNKWLLVTDSGEGSSLASASFGLPVLNSSPATSSAAFATPGFSGAIFTGTGDLANSSNGVVTLANNVVNEFKLIDDAISTNKIKNISVTNSKLANGISGSKLLDGSVNLAKINSTGINDGFIISGGGSVYTVPANTSFTAVSSTASADSMVVGTSYSTVRNLKVSPLGTTGELSALGLLYDEATGIYSVDPAAGAEPIIHLVANVNFRRNANDTGERTLILETVDTDPAGDGSVAPTAVEIISSKTVKGTVVGDYPMYVETTFKLAAYPGGAADADPANHTAGNGFRIRVKSGITHQTIPVYIGGRNAKDNISIVRLQ